MSISLILAISIPLSVGVCKLKDIIEEIYF